MTDNQDAAGTPEPTRPAGMVPRCPTSATDAATGEAHTIIGCGSTHVEWDGIEVWDCLDCGIFFNAEAVEWVAAS